MRAAIQTDAATCIGQHVISGADCWKAAEEEYVTMVRWEMGITEQFTVGELSDVQYLTT